MGGKKKGKWKKAKKVAADIEPKDHYMTMIRVRVMMGEQLEITITNLKVA